MKQDAQQFIQETAAKLITNAQLLRDAAAAVQASSDTEARNTAFWKAVELTGEIRNSFGDTTCRITGKLIEGWSHPVVRVLHAAVDNVGYGNFFVRATMVKWNNQRTGGIFAPAECQREPARKFLLLNADYAEAASAAILGNTEACDSRLDIRVLHRGAQQLVDATFQLLAGDMRLLESALRSANYVCAALAFGNLRLRIRNLISSFKSSWTFAFECARVLEYPIDHVLSRMCKPGYWHMDVFRDMDSPNAMLSAADELAPLQARLEQFLATEDLAQRYGRM